MFSEETNTSRLGGSIAQIQEEEWIKQRHPHVGGIELTPYCNLKCVHCYLQGQNYGTLMTTQQVKRIIDKLYDVGVLFLYFTGGEILTRPDFKEIYVYAKKKGFLVELLTNGTLIKPSLVELFNEYPPAAVSISMYGKDEKSYQRVTGDREAYDRVMNAFKLLKANGIHFEIKYIGVKENEGDLLEIKRIADEYGAVFSYSMEIFPTLQGNNCPKSHMIPIENIVKYEFQIDGKSEEYRKLASIKNEIAEKKEIPLFMCDMALSNFLIDYRGYLNPCHKCRYEKWNLLDCDFKEAWDDYGNLRKLKASPSNKCKECKYLMMCSPCVMVNYLSTGDYNSPPDSICQLTKLRVSRIKDCSNSDTSL